MNDPNENDGSTHLIRPGCLVSAMTTRCGLESGDWSESDRIGSEDGIRSINCLGCLHDLISYIRAADLGLDSPELRWAVDGDTGASSLTIWSVMTARPMPRGHWPHVPIDPDDFGRCHRMLVLFPYWRARLSEVSEAHPEWVGLVGAWNELTDLYLSELDSGRAPLTYARMMELRSNLR